MKGKFNISSVETSYGGYRRRSRCSKKVILIIIAALIAIALVIAVPFSLTTKRSSSTKTKQTVTAKPEDVKVKEQETETPIDNPREGNKEESVNQKVKVDEPERINEEVTGQEELPVQDLEPPSEQEPSNKESTGEHPMDNRDPQTENKEFEENTQQKDRKNTQQKDGKESSISAQTGKSGTKRSPRSEVIGRKEPSTYEQIKMEREKMERNLKQRFEMVERLKKGIQDPVKYIDGDLQTNLAEGTNHFCMQGLEVKCITYTELYYLAELTEFLKHVVNPKFEIEVLIKFKKYCTKYNVSYDHGSFRKYLYLFRRDVIKMERYNKNVGTGMKKGYYTRLVEDVPSEHINIIGYSGLFDGLGEQPFKHTPFLFEAKDDPQRATLDWREGGYIPDIKSRDKSKCASCWMLAAAAMYDAFVAIKGGKRSIHSAQQLLDCSSGFGDNSGGSLGAAFEYFKTKRLCLGGKYQFTGNKKSCDDSKCKGAPIIKSVVKIDAQNAEEHLRLNGPFVTAFGAPSELYDNYRGGVFEKNLGLGRRVTALVVGYGKDAKGKMYWIAQNTWSMDPNWGEDGYFRISDEVAKKKGGIFDNAFGISRKQEVVVP